MKLEGELRKKYIDEIRELYTTYLGEKFTGGHLFGLIENGELQAVASVRCYHGHWYFRGCVVKPEWRGNGFQRILMREGIQFLVGKTDKVRGAIYPWNSYSLQNVIAEKFEFEKTKDLPQGVGHVYVRNLEKRI